MAAEKNFENRIKDFLKSKNAWFIKYWAGGQFTKTGVPDILACVNGYFVAIEVKGPRGRPSDLQLYNIDKIRKAGGIAIVLYPDQFDKFKAMIDDLSMLPKNNGWEYRKQHEFDRYERGD